MDSSKNLQPNTILSDHLQPFFINKVKPNDMETVTDPTVNNKIFSVPIQTAINFSLKLHPGIQTHVPMIVDEVISWLVNKGIFESDTIINLLTEPPDKIFLDRLIRKANKGVIASLLKKIELIV